MKRIFFLSAFLLTIAMSATAQDGFTHVILRGGAVYRNAATAAVGLDFARQHFTSYELSLVYYRSAANYENYLAGVNYKPVAIRQKNSTVKFRLGGYVGSDLKDFVAAPNVGFEFIQSLSGKADLIISNNNGYFFFAPQPSRWRISAEVGIRFPL